MSEDILNHHLLSWTQLFMKGSSQACNCSWTVVSSADLRYVQHKSVRSTITVKVPALLNYNFPHLCGNLFHVMLCYTPSLITSTVFHFLVLKKKRRHDVRCLSCHIVSHYEMVVLSSKKLNANATVAIELSNMLLRPEVQIFSIYCSSSMQWRNNYDLSKHIYMIWNLKHFHADYSIWATKGPCHLNINTGRSRHLNKQQII